MSETIQPFRWLHISDLHFKAAASYDRDVVLNALLRSLPRLIERVGSLDLIVVSGDVAYSGKPEEYHQATIFLDELLRVSGLNRSQIVIIPGNHDIDRTKGKGLLRSLDNQESSDDYFDPSEPLLHVTMRQGGFTKWYDSFFVGNHNFSVNSSCCSLRSFSWGMKSVNFLLINTAIFCLDDTDSGKLWLGRRSIEKGLSQFPSGGKNYNFTVMHHPFNWLSQNEQANVKGAIRGASDGILTGHLHETDIEEVGGVVGGCLQLTAGAAYQTRKWPNTAMFCSLSEGSIEIVPIRYEDKPREVWTIDPSIYPSDPDFKFRTTIPGKTNDLPDTNPSEFNKNHSIINTDYLAIHIDPVIEAAKLDFERDLFISTSGKILYINPRLRTGQQTIMNTADDLPGEISVEDLVKSKKSYFVETRAEYGGTSLCRRLHYEVVLLRKERSILKDARELPNFKRKLELELSSFDKTGSESNLLIVDHFDFERHDKLLKEIVGLKYVNRLVVITVDRGATPTKLLEAESLPAEFDYIYLWNASRSSIREIAHILFGSSDETFVSAIVNKVYSDLLTLCIPSTPANIVMYLRILQREGEFHPLNRVDIVGRYIIDLLTRPSDAYADSFNSKNKADVLASFIFYLFQSNCDCFDDKIWHDFTSRYQKETLREFEADEFLQELFETRIFFRWNGSIYLKYRNFFAYFLGRYIAPRREVLISFLANEDYLAVDGIVDVISGLSSDNSLLVTTLKNKLKGLLSEFSTTYVKGQFDPLAGAIWSEDDSKDEQIWQQINKQIEAGPRSTKEIDDIKSSLYEEALTIDQQVNLEKFQQMEVALFSTRRVLGEALINSDDVGGDLKLQTYRAILNAHHIAFQIGSIFADQLARSYLVSWGGISFVGFNAVQAQPPSEIVTQNERIRVITSLGRAVANKAAEELGTSKLAPLFREKAKDLNELGSVDFTNFSAIVNAKGKSWFPTASAIIQRTDKNSYFLWAMLDNLMYHINYEMVQSKDLDSLKRLVALIQAKRRWKKQEPGQRAISQMLRDLDKGEYFVSDAKESTDGKI